MLGALQQNQKNYGHKRRKPAVKIPTRAGPRFTLGDLSEDHYTELPQGQAVYLEWAYFVQYNATFDGEISAMRSKTFTIHAYSEDGRMAFDDISKKSTVEDILVAASAKMGIPVRGISSNESTL